jgi:uncharacterized protein YggE
VLARTVAVLALVFLGAAPAALADTPTPGTLSAEGQGSVMVTPDQASLSVSVTRSAATSAVALSAANGRVDAIVSAVDRQLVRQGSGRAQGAHAADPPLQRR